MGRNWFIYGKRPIFQFEKSKKCFSQRVNFGCWSRSILLIFLSISSWKEYNNSYLLHKNLRLIYIKALLQSFFLDFSLYMTNKCSEDSVWKRLKNKRKIGQKYKRKWIKCAKFLFHQKVHGFKFDTHLCWGVIQAYLFPITLISLV